MEGVKTTPETAFDILWSSTQRLDLEPVRGLCPLRGPGFGY
jgi:hypothetical protein